MEDNLVRLWDGASPAMEMYDGEFSDAWEEQAARSGYGDYESYDMYLLNLIGA
jgi:hypothetical protein